MDDVGLKILIEKAKEVVNGEKDSRWGVIKAAEMILSGESNVPLFRGKIEEDLMALAEGKLEASELLPEKLEKLPEIKLKTIKTFEKRPARQLDLRIMRPVERKMIKPADVQLDTPQSTEEESVADMMVRRGIMKKIAS